MSVTLDMNWKSTAVVSGAGLLVTWLANQPVGVTPATQSRTPQTVVAPAAGEDIQQQADRLRARVRQEVAFGAPSRDPFRFAPRPAAVIPAPPAVAAEPVVPIVTAPPIRLSGVATDVVDGREERTAILSTPAGLVFAHEGEQIGGQFQVRAISEEAVVLIRLDDGSEVTLR